MEQKQKINCTVTSCRYNNSQMQDCMKDVIIVTPNENNNSGEAKESKCSSYKNK